MSAVMFPEPAKTTHKSKHLINYLFPYFLFLFSLLCLVFLCLQLPTVASMTLQLTAAWLTKLNSVPVAGFSSFVTVVTA